MGYATVLVAVIVVLAIGSSSSAGADRMSRPALTPTGTALWDFEALLRDTFRGKGVCVVSKSGGPDFVSKPCAALSLAQAQPYLFKFAGAKDSRYHLVRRARPDAGIHPIPIAIRGLYVACDADAKTFLFTNSAQYGFSPGCYPITGSG